MQRLGFIHDMLDVKVLILYVASRSDYPMTTQELYELCYQDECLSYFDVCTAIPEMVKTGHLKEVDGDRYEITEKGKEDGALTADSIAFTVKQKAEHAVENFNRNQKRSNFVKTQLLAREGGDFSVIMTLDDKLSNLMTLELVAPDQRQAVRLSRMFEKKADEIYNLVMNELLEAEETLGE